jgi:putative transposase
LVTELTKEHSLSFRKACTIACISRSSFAYKHKIKDDKEWTEMLDNLTQKHVNIGFWSLYHRIRNNRKNKKVNHKKLYRIYTEMKLNIRRRRKKRLPKRLRSSLTECVHTNQVWSMDFVSDKLFDGRAYRILNIIDEYNRESLYLDVDTSLPARRVTRSLDLIAFSRGYPSNIRVDNGPEFISKALSEWATKNNVSIIFIEPGKPMQNGKVERNNRSMRNEVLDPNMFKSLKEVRNKLEEWQKDYNNDRPHKSLNYMSPVDFTKSKSA